MTQFSTDRGSQYYQIFMRNYRFKNPICSDPFGIHKKLNETVATKDVHHIIPYKKDISKCYAEDNLISLCPICHMAIHGKKKYISYILNIIGIAEYKKSLGYLYYNLQKEN